MRRFEGKTVIVTGGNSGIGKAIAVRFAREGARVVLFARNKERLEKAANEIKGLGSEAHIVCGDVSRKEDITRCVEETLQLFGRIDVLINNAAIVIKGPFLGVREEDWDSVLDVNLKGPFMFSQAVAREMVKNKSGVIVNISSTNAHRGYPTVVSYNASKGGLNALTRTMAVELAHEGIRVNAIIAGEIRTPMSAESLANKEWLRQWLSRVPQGRVGEPEEIARACAFLASDEASFMTGSLVVVDGGELTH